MQRRQPNPRIRTRADLNPLAREHYDVARSLGGQISRSGFLERYRVMFPERNPGSILPSDYCFNQGNKGNAQYPRFLLAEGRARYLFVGVDGKGDSETAPPNHSADRGSTGEAKAPVLSAAVASSRHLIEPSRTRLFVPAPGHSLTIRREVATQAIQAYNADAGVLRQEQQAYDALGRGFVRGSTFAHLRALNFAYRTRASISDLAIIARTIEDGFDQWTGSISAVGDLAEHAPDRTDVLEGLRPFLSALTEKQPRSLATKSLHFQQPQKFIPADSYAVNRLGEELSAGSWADTDGIDLEAMATWYWSYLRAIHNIGILNASLLRELFDLDQRTGPQHFFERVRGLPKILDKILWWLGRELRRGRHILLFEHDV